MSSGVRAFPQVFPCLSPLCHRPLFLPPLLKQAQPNSPIQTAAGEQRDASLPVGSAGGALEQEQQQSSPSTFVGGEGTQGHDERLGGVLEVKTAVMGTEILGQEVKHLRRVNEALVERVEFFERGQLKVKVRERLEKGTELVAWRRVRENVRNGCRRHAHAFDPALISCRWRSNIYFRLVTRSHISVGRTSLL